MIVSPDLLEPDTASNVRSIWRGLDRTTFEQRTQDLVARKHVPGRCSYQGRLSQTHDRPYPLPFEVEKSLVDAFAFIAAAQPEAGYVSAAAIEQQNTNDSFLLKLTANEGVSKDVRETFDGLFEMLRKHANKSMSRQVCQEQIFALIVRLNCNKILGRLGSRLFKPPKHLPRTQEPLPFRLRCLVRKNLPGTIQARGREDLKKLYCEINRFEVAMRALDIEPSEDTVSYVGLAVKEAYRLTENGVRFPDRLRAIGCKDSCLDARDVREVGKVSNYWRISRHLAICSKQFRSCFANAQWLPLPNYKPSTTFKPPSRQYIHAEIQLLVHFELSNPRLMPRTIGVSKEACFLCDAFIRAHGWYHISGAHRQIFPKWTIPDLEEYTVEIIDKFRRALSQVFLEVEREHQNAQERFIWRPYPLQSAIDLNVIHFTTPSASTLPGVKSHESSRTGGSDTSSTLSRMQRKEINAGLKGEDLPMAESGEKQSIDGKDSTSEPRGGATEPAIDIIADGAFLQRTGWLEMFAALSSSPGSITPAIQPTRFERVSVALEPVTDGVYRRRVRLAELPVGCDIVLDRHPSDAAHEVSFVLIGSRDEEEVLVRCQWHASSKLSTE